MPLTRFYAWNLISFLTLSRDFIIEFKFTEKFIFMKSVGKNIKKEIKHPHISIIGYNMISYLILDVLFPPFRRNVSRNMLSEFHPARIAISSSALNPDGTVFRSAQALLCTPANLPAYMRVLALCTICFRLVQAADNEAYSSLHAIWWETKRSASNTRKAPVS